MAAKRSLTTGRFSSAARMPFPDASKVAAVSCMTAIFDPLIAIFFPTLGLIGASHADDWAWRLSNDLIRVKCRLFR